MKIGIGQKNKKPENESDEDDEIIDYFLQNNKDWVICEWFLKGTCRYDTGCKYMHPASMAPIDKFGEGGPKKIIGKNG